MDYVQRNNITWCEPIYYQLKNMNNTMRGKVRPMTCCVDIQMGIHCLYFIMPNSICKNIYEGKTLVVALKEIKETILKEFSALYKDVDFYCVGDNGEIYHYNDLLEE